MAKEDLILSELNKINSRLGNIEGHNSMMKDYVDKVSIKAGDAREKAEDAGKAADVALDLHKSDLAAHGAGAVAKAVGLVGGVAAVVGALWKGFTVIGGHKG